MAVERRIEAWDWLTTMVGTWNLQVDFPRMKRKVGRGTEKVISLV
jgi:hypothetical protein